MRFYFALLLLSLTGCLTATGEKPVAITVQPTLDNVLLLNPTLNRFSNAGPYKIMERLDREVTLDLDHTIVIDHFAINSVDKRPVIIISHGNYSSKAAHRYQARHLASWGFHVVTFEVPNRNQWLENGDRLRQFANLIYNVPTILGKSVDPSRIIFVGHSFGGSASILAMAQGAPVIGAILLDPAVVHDSVVSAMKRIDLPVVLLGSDRSIFLARGRSQFSKNLKGELLEVSVPLSTHDDAQGPSMFSRSSLGVDPFTSVDRQDIFKAMLTSGVIGMASSGTLDFPNKIMIKETKSGRLTRLTYHARNNN